VLAAVRADRTAAARRDGLLGVPATAPDGNCAQPVLLERVPFHPQEAFQCGPAALAGVLGASGLDLSPEALAPQVYLPGRQGSLQAELLAAARRAGRVPYLIRPEPAELLAQLAAGRPVLVLQNLQTPEFPVWHYAVVVGHDPAANRLLVNSGGIERDPQRASVFLRRWNWAGRWAMVALAPGELPADPDPLRYAQAVADFEPVAGREPATRAWQAARARWPDDPRPALALGNLAYAAGDLEAAMAHYREGLASAPGDAVLGNNLASVLGELGCARRGEALAREVAAGLAPDAQWSAALAQTLAELAARPGDDPARCAER
jgi:tetratricopeptide (TPR) repeat protein